MLSAKVRWRPVALFALFALVPAVSLGVLGFSAVRTTEVTAQREVAAMLAAAADRSSRTIDRSLRASEEALSRASESAEPARFEADLRNVAPPFADAIALRPDRTWIFPAPPSTKPPVRDPTCDADLARLSSQPEAASRKELRARLLAACAEARAPSGRFVWPLVALDALRDREGDPEALAAWIEQHAADLSPAERRATLLDIAALTSLPEPLRARTERALAAGRSRTDDLDREIAVAEARAAFEQAQRTTAVVPWKSPTSVGAVRRLPSGDLVGFVVHDTSLTEALERRRIELDPELRAEVVAGARALADGTATRSAGVPGASVEIAPLLLLRLLPRDPGIVARQARRSRYLLGAVGVGSTLFACALAALLYRRMRAVERSSDLRTDFVSTVSHELRTPIASVRMLAELLEDERVPPDEQPEVFTALARESRRLGETVDRLLGFSRMAAGRHTVDRRRANVASTITPSLDAFEERHPEMPKLERSLDTSIEADIDADQLRLAVDNLLANAKKYAPDGAPYAVSLARSEGAVVLRVEDRGPGVEPRDRKRIFEPFERADDRLSRATEGSGIGLSLVAHVAKAHGGRAWVEPRRGGGAAFCIRIEGAEEKRA